MSGFKIKINRENIVLGQLEGRKYNFNDKLSTEQLDDLFRSYSFLKIKNSIFACAGANAKMLLIKRRRLFFLCRCLCFAFFALCNSFTQIIREAACLAGLFSFIG